MQNLCRLTLREQQQQIRLVKECGHAIMRNGVVQRDEISDISRSELESGMIVECPLLGGESVCGGLLFGSVVRRAGLISRFAQRADPHGRRPLVISTQTFPP